MDLSRLLSQNLAGEEPYSFNNSVRAGEWLRNSIGFYDPAIFTYLYCIAHSRWENLRGTKVEHTLMQFHNNYNVWRLYFVIPSNYLFESPCQTTRYLINDLHELQGCVQEDDGVWSSLTPINYKLLKK